LQYEKKLSNIKLLKKYYPEFVLITQTTISKSYKAYELIQKNHKIINYIHTLAAIKKKLLKGKYKIIYLSYIDQALNGFKKKIL